MRLLLSEFFDELSRDPTRNVFLVEGIRDLNFWRRLVPTVERGNVVIISIDELMVSVSHGGNRGRMLAAANAVQQTEFVDRVKFFVDSDSDIFLGRVPPDNVFFTDGRDLENYSACVECLDSIASDAFGATLDAVDFLVVASRLLRPIAAIRITSEQQNLDLPFQKTFGRGFDRFIDGETGELKCYYLIEVLLQNAGRSLAERDALLKDVERQQVSLSSFRDDEIIHGKDFIKLLARKFGVSFEEMERHVFMALAHHAQTIALRPNVARAVAWIRSRK